MTPELSAMLFGLFAAVSWGAGDFSGGLATKRVHIIGVVIVSQIIGITLLALCAFVLQEAIPPIADLLLGALAGVIGLVGLACLYRGLAIGRAGIVAPISSAISAIIPIIYSIIISGWPQATQTVGFILALISICLVSYSAGREEQLRGFRLAIVAGLGFAGFFILLDRIESNSVFWVLIAARSASLFIMMIFVLVSRHAIETFVPRGKEFGIVALAGVMDVGGNVFFVLATQSNRLDIASVVASLYPAVTILLAWWLLAERLTTLQLVGVTTALLAIALISL